MRDDIEQLNYKIEEKTNELKKEEINLVKLDQYTHTSVSKYEDKIEQLKSNLNIKDQFSTDPEKRENSRNILKQIEECENVIDELQDTLNAKKDNINKIRNEMDE